MIATTDQRFINRGIRVQEHSIVLGFIFLVLPIFDMLNGFLIVQGYLPAGALGSPSQIGRLLATFILLIFTPRSSFTSSWLLLFTMLIVIETIAGFRAFGAASVLVGYLMIVRFFYLFLLFHALVRYFNKDFRLIGKYLKLNLNLINASLVIAFATGLGNSTYGWGFGTKGFFASGNGLGVYIGVATFILIALQHNGIYRKVGLFTLLLSLLALLLLGTKTAFLLASFLAFFIIWKSSARIILLPAVAFAIYYFLEDIIDQLTILFDIIIIRYKNSDSFFAYVLSSRDNYILDALANVSVQDIGILRWLFGAGAFLSFQNPSHTVVFDTLETDFFDVLFMYGAVGLAIYLLFLVYEMKLFTKYPYFLFATVILAGHSLIAGHVLFNGMGSSLLVVLLAIGCRLQNVSNYGMHATFIKRHRL